MERIIIVSVVELLLWLSNNVHHQLAVTSCHQLFNIYRIAVSVQRVYVHRATESVHAEIEARSPPVGRSPLHINQPTYCAPAGAAFQRSRFLSRNTNIATIGTLHTSTHTTPP